jgi:hypothetical protein
MVKSKKLSRGSLAVLLLALLLAVSMVVGLTGAWFTDKDNGSSSLPFTFGSVAVTVGDTAMARSENDTINADLFLPGDKVAVQASTLTYGGTGDAYVYYGYELSIKAQFKKVVSVATDGTITYEQESGADKVYTVELKDAVTTESGSVLAFTRTFANQGDAVAEIEGKLQLFTSASAPITFPGYTLTFNTAVDNVIYDENNARYVLNLGNNYLVNLSSNEQAGGAEANSDTYNWKANDFVLASQTFTMKVTVFAYAIQAKNLTAGDLQTWLATASGKTATINTLPTREAAEAGINASDYLS